MSVTIMFLLHFLLIKRNYYIFDFGNFQFDTDQNATFPLLTYLKITDFLTQRLATFPKNLYLLMLSLIHI